MKFALGVKYHGRNYHGWQSQKNTYTIQYELEKALSKIANHKVDVVCAGRTDAGVHSICQVVHFSTQVVRCKKSWIFGVNSYLPNDIAVIWIKLVPESFHARYSALTRSYRYIIYNNTVRPVILEGQVYHYYKNLDIEKMHRSAQYLKGEHDFTTFRAQSCQSSTAWRNIIYINVMRINAFVVINIQANSFLHRMVRNIVGSLLEVGIQKKSEDWIQKVLELKNRSLAGPTVASKGLYLISIEYPTDFKLPQITCGSLFY
ncbi:MAG TPA: tRNA pseudouridine(38-40) synthase TruA [Buchnera sp. (in: enterobacteria)]|nr:tRNA pseudouridine(38-40) synthase TruA [Buchnera sp. (in: enterobacteria)]